MSDIITEGGDKKGVECGPTKVMVTGKNMDTRGYKIENRTQALCQKICRFSLLEPLTISKMRTDENIIMKPTHSLIDSN